MKPESTSKIAFSTFGILLSFSLLARSSEQPAYEMSCRIKAKEVAAETYRGCVVENRKSLIDKVRSDYQNKLKSLKNQYEEELNGLSGSAQPNTTQANQTTQTTQATPGEPKIRKSTVRSTSRLSANRGLPRKQSSLRETAPAPREDERGGQLRHSNGEPQAISDDSMMDIPEPIPVESPRSNDSDL